jgi:hypothetical protein
MAGCSDEHLGAAARREGTQPDARVACRCDVVRGERPRPTLSVGSAGQVSER